MQTLDPDEAVARNVEVRLVVALVAAQPGEIGAARASLLQGDPVLADEILGGVG
jgi:hypothetical protein